ncbi:MAG: sugar phosphate isomerase/epimerase family protein [Bacillota bacterium]
MFKLAISSKIMQGFCLQEIINYTAQTGFNGLELWMHQVQASGLTAGKLKKLAAAAGLTCQVHMDTRDSNIASSNRVIREASIKQVLSAIEYAADLEARVITVHPGRFTEEKEALSSQEAWNRQIEAFAVLACKAESKDMIIGIENMEKRPKEFVLTEADIKKIVQAVGSNRLMVTLDVAHLHHIGDVTQIIKAWQLPIVNVHISQANSKMHLPIFAHEAGGIDYAKVFPQLAAKYQGLLVVEGYIPGKEKENVKKSYEWLKACTASPKYCLTPGQ